MQNKLIKLKQTAKYFGYTFWYIYFNFCLFFYGNSEVIFTIARPIWANDTCWTHIFSSFSRPNSPPRAQDGSALHSLTALPSLGAVITLT